MKYKGNYYKSTFTDLVVKCLEDSDSFSFYGVVVSEDEITSNKLGEISDSWVSDSFYLVKEYNNGWTKLVPDMSLPTQEGKYIVGKMNDFGFKEFENRLSLEILIYQIKLKHITHYKLYESLPPKF